MTEELNHCEQLSSSPLKSRDQVHDECVEGHFQNNFVVGPPDEKEDEESTDQSPDASDTDSSRKDWVSSTSPYSSSDEFDSKLLRSPLTALTFPPPPPIEDEDFEDDVTASSTDSKSQYFDEIDLHSTVDRIVSAAIQEAVLIETLVSMAMRDAVAALILKVNPLQEEECLAEEVKPELSKLEDNNKNDETSSVSSNDPRRTLDNQGESKAENSDPDKVTSSPSRTTPVVEENFVEVDKTVSIANQSEDQEIASRDSAEQREINGIVVEEENNFSNEIEPTPENLEAVNEPTGTPMEEVEAKISDEVNQAENEEETSDHEGKLIASGETEKVEVEINHRTEATIKTEENETEPAATMTNVVIVVTNEESEEPTTSDSNVTSQQPSAAETCPGTESVENPSSESKTAASCENITQQSNDQALVEPASREIQTTEPASPETNTTKPANAETKITEQTSAETNTTEPADADRHTTEPAGAATNTTEPADADRNTTEPVSQEIHKPTTEPTEQTAPQAASTSVEQPKTTLAKKSGCCVIV